MSKDKMYELLEKKIDALRKKDKGDEERKTYDEVFDRHALLSIYKLMCDGIIDTIDYPISTGKEGNVFKGTSPEKNNIAIKIYRVSTATFRNLSKYVIGDPRFKGMHKNYRKLIHTWARKEFRNLKRMREGGVSVPTPFSCHNNVLVMEYIGDDISPSPMLKDAHVEDAKKMFRQVVNNTKKIYKTGLVHGDLSEYNILVKENKPVIIDVAQAVTLEHFSAEDWLKRDVKNVARYFRKIGVEVKEDDLLKRIIGG